MALWKIRQPKKASGARGGSLEAVEQGPCSLPIAGIPEQRFPGPSSPRRRAAAAGRAAEANFAEWLFFKNNFAFVSRSGLLQIE